MWKLRYRDAEGIRQTEEFIGWLEAHNRINVLENKKCSIFFLNEFFKSE